MASSLSFNFSGFDNETTSKIEFQGDASLLDKEIHLTSSPMQYSVGRPLRLWDATKRGSWLISPPTSPSSSTPPILDYKTPRRRPFTCCSSSPRILPPCLPITDTFTGRLPRPLQQQLCRWLEGQHGGGRVRHLSQRVGSARRPCRNRYRLDHIKRNFA
ncbi:unnamed protein product, partial [Musa acuminata var. zebrina]